MMKYPIGVQSFEKIREDGFAYVDLIYRLTHEGNIYFLSRPRRFGKSLLVSTLKNYFLGRKELFEGLAISSLEKEWLEYPVFHICGNRGKCIAVGVSVRPQRRVHRCRQTVRIRAEKGSRADRPQMRGAH